MVAWYLQDFREKKNIKNRNLSKQKCKLLKFAFKILDKLIKTLEKIGKLFKNKLTSNILRYLRRHLYFLLNNLSNRNFANVLKWLNNYLKIIMSKRVVVSFSTKKTRIGCMRHNSYSARQAQFNCLLKF